MKRKKIIRIVTVPISFKHLLKDQMSFMYKNGFDVIMISSNGIELNDVIKNEKCKHFIIPLTRKITPIKDLIATFRIYLLLIKEKPDIVHTHTPKAGITGMLASYLANIPLRLHTVAGLPLVEAKGFKRVLLNFVEKLTCKFSTKVYPNSFGMKNIILKNNFTNKNKLKVIGSGSSNGIDTSYFDPKLYSSHDKNSLKHELGIKRKDFVFIYVGRLVGDKGINELIKAFSKLSLSIKYIKLLLVGPFEDDLDPLNIKTKLIIDSHDKIISVGYQNDVRPYFSISNSLVFPSYREGFPNVVMQAGAMGLPSIVTDINGCNEIIKNGYNGIIIPVKEIEFLKKAMFRIFQDKDLYSKCLINSRLEIIKNYEQKKFWKALLNEYKYQLKKL